MTKGYRFGLGLYDCIFVSTGQPLLRSFRYMDGVSDMFHRVI